MTTGVGRRERKKAETQRALSRAATRLFLDRGYDAVSVADVAAEADTAVTTLFAHFPDGKQALVFGGGEDRAAAITAAIRQRDPGVDPLAALERFIHTRGPFGQTPNGEHEALFDLIAETPALRDYARRRWVDCEDTLTATLAQELALPPEPHARSLARFALEAPQIAGRADDPAAALTDVFASLRRGWLTETCRQ